MLTTQKVEILICERGDSPAGLMQRVNGGDHLFHGTPLD